MERAARRPSLLPGASVFVFRFLFWFVLVCFFLQLQPVYGDPLIRRPESLCEKFSHPEVPPARKSRPRVQVVLNFFFLFALLAGFLKNYFVYIPQSPPFGNHQSVLRI